MKRILSRNRDLLGFQILNWSGSVLLFSAFARFEDAQAFARIGKAEVMLGCVGVFLLSASLRRHADGISRQGEQALVWLRLGLLLGGWLGALAGVWHVLYALAGTAVAAIPAHLPLLLGYRPLIYVLLLSKLAVAGVSFALSGFGMSTSALAAIYFAPSILYGLGCYAFYWGLLPNADPSVEAPRAKRMSMQRHALQFIVIAACNIAQSNLVFQIIRLHWEAAVTERLLRSAYSFCFPYTVRHGIWSKKSTLGLAFAVLSFIALLILSGAQSALPALMLGPVMLDVFSSAIAGRFLLVDAGMLLLLLVSGLITP